MVYFVDSVERPLVSDAPTGSGTDIDSMSRDAYSRLSDSFHASTSSPRSSSDNDVFNNELERLLKMPDLSLPIPTPNSSSGSSAMLDLSNMQSSDLDSSASSSSFLPSIPSSPPLPPLSEPLTVNDRSIFIRHSSRVFSYFFIFLTLFFSGYFIYGLLDISLKSDVPVLLADTDTVGEAPTDSEGTKVLNQDHQVYGVLDDGSDSVIPSSDSDTTTTATAITDDSTTTPLRLPADTDETNDLLTSSAKIVDTVRITPSLSSSVSLPSTTSSASSDTFLTTPQESSDTTTTATPSPSPKPKPESAPSPTPTPAATITTASSSSLPFAVQLSSLRSESQARDSWQQLQSRFSDILSGLTPEIRRVDLSGKGTYYRLRIPTRTNDEAQSLCNRLKSAGGDCLIAR